ncbi:lactonase family protein [Candidatus Entotheonella palauensis]|uniref:lactonase family protein n=1 Tax=Candidatus Entotheonella palauensis TaxID=93172 RepID=UPI000B7CA9B5|nr:beta-propeller fold lactonase family protein [Candidatus Entotheonella palauensis]
MPYYMYVALQEDDQISVLTIDPQTGTLTPQVKVSVPGGPFTMAISPDRKFLYAGCRDTPQISSFQIDPANGGLTQNGTVSLEAWPVYVSTDRIGEFLLSAYYQGGLAAVHPIGEDGSVGAPPIEWLATATGAHAMQTDLTNRYAFVPHIAGNGPNAIFQYRFDDTTGRLTPNSPARVEPEAFLGPRHFCFHPSLDILYFSNEQDCSVTGYHLDTTTGTLSAFQTITTLPDGYTERNTCSQIQVTASGRFLYAPNRGHNSIACFSVDMSTGELTATGRVSSEPIPNALCLDPQDKFLFSAGQESGRMAAFSINSDSGELIPLETYPLGNRPTWVSITELSG